jgi:2-polyprenyl-3-methyl-5-hydroxy-6-metoxy-1,4-benzoquinol methylase
MTNSAGHPPETAPYLDYYRAHDIIPVRQDISKLDLHIARRRALYEQLGLPAIAFRGAQVIEFGPGTGDNAIAVAAWHPARQVLVDGNPASLRAIRDKIAAGLLPETSELREADITALDDPARYDIVLCEGVIPGQADAAGFLRKVAGFAAACGVAVITTMPALGCLAEICRRLVKPVFARRTPDFERLKTDLAAFFKPDLASLTGMSRLPEDWVLDNILHPWPANAFFSLPEAVDALAPSFEVLGTGSPQFMRDFRWYKSIPFSDLTRSDLAKSAYWAHPEIPLDYRVDRPASPGDPALGQSLERDCTRLFLLQREIWEQDEIDRIPEFLAALEQVNETILRISPLTSDSVIDFCRGMTRLLEGADAPDFGRFTPWFGRGQQYVSFIRRG